MLMQKSWVALFAIFFGLFSVAQVAEAKRFGGGSSFGYSKSTPNKNYNTAPKAAPAAKPAAPAAAGAAAGTAAKSGASKWLGPLAGLAVGGLLAAMIFGDGFEGIQIMDILIFGLIAFLLYKLFVARKRSQNPQAAYERSHAEQEAQTRYEPETVQQRQAQAQPEHQAYDPNAGGSIFGSALGEAPSDQAVQVSEVPEWFNAEQFVEGAKSHFVSLQKAWDAVDVSEVQAYCTPELFAEIQKEMQGMQPGDNVTVVDTLDAEIADMAIDGEHFVVSIRFSGFIQESVDESAHAFNEVWHIRRDASDQGNWLVAGIQQQS